MASPHVAGLAAYFLSLYPESFNPTSEEFEESVYSPFTFSSSSGDSTTSSYFNQLVIGNLKRFTSVGVWVGKVQHWTGMGREVTVAPIPGKDLPLSPKDLKKAMLKLCTKDALVAAVRFFVPLSFHSLFESDSVERIRRRIFFIDFFFHFDFSSTYIGYASWNS